MTGHCFVSIQSVKFIGDSATKDYSTEHYLFV